MDCGFPQVAEVFEECLYEALTSFSAAEMQAWIEAARFLAKMGRGPEPALVLLEEWPAVANAAGHEVLPAVMAAVRAMQRSPNSGAIVPFLQTLAAVARRLPARETLEAYIALALDLMLRTTGSIHGHHSTFPSPGLPEFFRQAPRLVATLSLTGIRKWIDYGVHNHGTHPERQATYFSLQSADSLAVLQRERHGTLFADVERRLNLFLRALWREDELLVPYSTAHDELRRPVPYYDAQGMRVPDVLEDSNGIAGLDRYRAILAHMAGHRRWTTPQVADNWSPFQRLAVEFFEDARIELLLSREYPGLGRLFRALHPRPSENACDPATTSCLRHRLAMMSRALLDPEHGYADADLLEFVDRFHALLASGPSSTGEVALLALAWVARTRRPSDQFAHVHFDDTVVEYRDDNRQMWRFIEQGDEEESFDEPRRPPDERESHSLPPRHYPEWDYRDQSFRPDWVSVYEALHPAGDGALIDRLLEKHAALAKRLKRMLDLLKPQDKVRIRHQEEGSELDLDIALRSLIDLKSGAQPDPRINMSHRTDGRDISVMLLLDLSESLNEKVPDGSQSVLDLAREAVALLGWAIAHLGDPFAIAGFQSNTRHEVRFWHLKGFSETWDDTVKSRLAATTAGWSTRMGAALRHGGHYLAHRDTERKILLVLTDGEPADVDVNDPEHLRADAKKAVEELATQGVSTFCLSLDPNADDYVQRIFGPRHLVLDRIERLPERLPELYLRLTR